MFGIGVIVFSVVFVGLSHRGSRSDTTMLRLPWYDSPTNLLITWFLFVCQRFSLSLPPI